MNKNILALGGAAVIGIAVLYIIAQNNRAMAQIQSSGDMPKNYIDSYWQNLKGSIGRLF